MSGISQEQHAPVFETFEYALLIGIDALPDDLIGAVADGGDDAPVERIGLPGSVKVFAGGKLVIEAVDTIRLGMEQGRAPGVKRRVEPEPAFARGLQLHAHIQDEEVVITRCAGEIEPEQVTHAAPRAIGSQHIGGIDAVSTARCFELDTY